MFYDTLAEVHFIFYFFRDKFFYGSNPIISWNKTDIGAFFTMISRIFTEYDKNCFSFKVINIVYFKKNLTEMAIHKVLLLIERRVLLYILAKSNDSQNFMK